jgi:hypothetical protein
MTATISADRVRAVLRVAWLAVALGIAVQIVVFAVRIAAGLKVPAAMLMADLTQGTTWGVIVCVGVAVGELIFPIGCALVIYAPVHMRRFAGLA